MPRSSPAAPRVPRGARRSLQHSTPERLQLADFLTPVRNTEANHREALQAAADAHNLVRERALKTLEEFEANEAVLRVQEEQAREQERLKAEQTLRAEQERLRALKAQSVPQLPPEPVVQTAPKAAPVQTQHQVQYTPAPVVATQAPSTTPATAINGLSTPSTTATPAQPAKSTLFGVPTTQAPPSVNPTNPFAQAIAAQQPAKTAAPFQQPTPSISQGKAPATANNPFASQPAINGASSSSQAPQPTAAEPVDRHTIIHQNLKQLRASLASQASGNPALKNRLGDMRREIRKSVGQLSLDRVANRKVVSSVASTEWYELFSADCQHRWRRLRQLCVLDSITRLVASPLTPANLFSMTERRSREPLITTQTYPLSSCIFSITSLRQSSASS